MAEGLILKREVKKEGHEGREVSGTRWPPGGLIVCDRRGGLEG
jgi:hypothetical protein